MSKNNFGLPLVSDLELLDMTISYLDILYSRLPYSRLRHHCNGALASVFELVYYLKSHGLEDYGNNYK